MWMSGMMLGLSWSPLVSPWLSLPLGATVAVLAAAVYAQDRRKRPGLARWLLAMRLVLLSAWVTLLLGPVGDVAVPAGSGAGGTPAPARKRTLAVLVDTSESMRTVDAGETTSRMEQVRARWLTAGNLAKLRERYVVKLLRFDEETRPLTEAELDRGAELATGRVTLLGEALERALAELPREPGGTILVVSDGRGTFEPTADADGATLRARQVRAYTAAVGRARTEVDLAVTTSVLGRVRAGRSADLVVDIHQAGAAGRRVLLTAESGQFRVSEEVELKAAASTRVVLRTGPLRGTQAIRCVVKVEALAEESWAGNNQAEVVLTPEAGAARVLLLEGDPGWDSRFLADALGRDDQVELTTFFALREGVFRGWVFGDEAEAGREMAKRAGTAIGSQGGVRGERVMDRPPSTAAGLSGFDVVILGRDVERLLPESAAGELARWVEGGGVLMCWRGWPAGREAAGWRRDLEAVAALRTAPAAGAEASAAAAKVKLAAGTPAGFLGAEVLGDEPDAALGSMPEGTRADGRMEAAAGARVLLEGADGEPVLAVRNVGRGRAAWMGVEGLWRWRMEPPAGREGVYDGLARGLVQWLTDPEATPRGRLVWLRRWPGAALVGGASDVEVAAGVALPEGFSPVLTLVDPSGSRLRIPLERLADVRPTWRGTIRPRTSGIHTLELDGRPVTRSLEVRELGATDVNLERTRVSADEGYLAELARQTGGRMLEGGKLSPLLENAGEEAAARGGAMGRVAAAPVQTGAGVRAAMLVVMMTWMLGEWWLRRKAGWT